MASIYKRKSSPYYWVKYQDRYSRERRRSTNISRLDRPAAMKYLIDLEAALVVGDDLPARMGIMDSCEKWIKSLRSRNLSKRTVSEYTHRVNQFLDFWGEQFPNLTLLSDITPISLEQYLEHLTSMMGSSTIRLNFSMLGIFLNWCIKMGWMKDNPIQRVSMPKSDRKEPDVFTIEHLSVIFNRGEPIFEFLYRMGARITETLLMKVEDIDFNKGLVKFRAENCKSRTDDFLDIPDKLLPVLEFLCKGHSPSHYLFKHYGTLGMTKEYYRNMLKKFTGSGIANPKFHTFRHTAITHWVEAGVPLKTVQRLARHKCIHTTLKYYVHLSPDAPGKQINRLPI